MADFAGETGGNHNLALQIDAFSRKLLAGARQALSPPAGLACWGACLGLDHGVQGKMISEPQYRILVPLLAGRLPSAIDGNTAAAYVGQEAALRMPAATRLDTIARW